MGSAPGKPEGVPGGGRLLPGLRARPRLASASLALRSGDRARATGATALPPTAIPRSLADCPDPRRAPPESCPAPSPRGRATLPVADRLARARPARPARGTSRNGDSEHSLLLPRRTGGRAHIGESSPGADNRPLPRASPPEPETSRPAA